MQKNSYISKNELQKDSRFYVDEKNIDRLLSKPICSYAVKRMQVGMILRSLEDTNKIVTLDKTRVYAYLKGGEDGMRAYKEYMKSCNYVNFRTPTNYNNLIESLNESAYNIKKGAIVVSQHNLILDGQHRCCILLNKFGPNYIVEVLQLTYIHRYIINSPLFLWKLWMAKLKARRICKKDWHGK